MGIRAGWRDAYRDPGGLRVRATRERTACQWSGGASSGYRLSSPGSGSPAGPISSSSVRSPLVPDTVASVAAAAGVAAREKGAEIDRFPSRARSSASDTPPPRRAGAATGGALATGVYVRARDRLRRRRGRLTAFVT